MKRIMILGAGDYQLPLIEAAKKENYITVVCDYNANAVGVGMADIFYQISTMDEDAVMEAAKKEAVDGIIGNSEAVMPIVAKVSSRLNLIGNSAEAIHQLTSKKLFRDLQKRAHCFSPDHIEASEWSECKQKICTLQYPLVVKPSESSGSRGTTPIQSKDELYLMEEAFNECKKYSRNGKVTVEEYIAMPSVQVVEGEVFVNQGKVLFDGLFTTIRSKHTPLIPMTYCFPAFLNDQQVDRIKTDITALLREAGIMHGEYNIELYFTENDDLFVIEINARQGGNQLPVYVGKHCSIDMYKLLVTTTVGEQYYWDEVTSFKNQKKNIVHHVLFPRETGILDSVTVDKCWENCVSKTHMYKKSGENITETTDSTHKIGYIDFEFNTLEEEKLFAANPEDWVRVNVRR